MARICGTRHPIHPELPEPIPGVLANRARKHAVPITLMVCYSGEKIVARCCCCCARFEKRTETFRVRWFGPLEKCKIVGGSAAGTSPRSAPPVDRRVMGYMGGTDTPLSRRVPFRPPAPNWQPSGTR